MPEIKVQCDCGQRYKFDVEPVNGRMPFTVTCPVCGMNGTEKANDLLRELAFAPPPAPAAPPPPPKATTPIVLRPMSAAPPPPSAPPPPPVPRPIMASAASVAAPVAASALASPTEKPRLRINRSAPEAEPAAAAVVTGAAPPPPPAPPVSRPRPGSRRPTPVVAPEQKGRFGLGVLGGLLGALVGSAIFFVIFNYADFQVGVMGIGVGFLAGLGARLMGKVGSNELGVITGTFTVVGILGAIYLSAWSSWHEAMQEVTQMSMYETRVAEAKEVIAAVPTGSDAEIRLYLAKMFTEEGEAPKVSLITADQIKAFREVELPEYQNLASGKITKQQFEEQHKEELEALKKIEDFGEKTFKWWFLFYVLNKVTIISTCAGAGLAYKMSTDA